MVNGKEIAISGIWKNLIPKPIPELPPICAPVAPTNFPPASSGACFLERNALSHRAMLSPAEQGPPESSDLLDAPAIAAELEKLAAAQITPETAKI